MKIAPVHCDHVVEERTVLCAHCSSENEPKELVCGGCGARLGVPCAACGAPTAPVDRYCSGCGVQLRSAAPSETLPDHLARKTRTARLALVGQRKQVTVLFADLKDSLELMVDRDPEDTRTLLDAVLARMMGAVRQYEGTVNQVMGDGIMALFGAPIAHEDHAARACCAALLMQSAVGRYAQEVASLEGLSVRIRVGLNSGEVVVRSIDNDLQFDYSAVGQTTHLAARMEQLAKPGTILITEATRRLAERHIAVDTLGAVNVKGLRYPVHVHELRGSSAAPECADAQRTADPLFGRERELEQLHALCEKAAAGAGQVVALVGEPGIGKSRLIAELVAERSRQGWIALEGSGVSYAVHTPYLSFVTALRHYFGVDEDEPVGGVRDRVGAALVARGIGIDRALPALLALSNLSVEDREWDRLEPPERRQRIFSVVTELLMRESLRQPVLLVFENLQWADAESRALLDHLAAAVPRARILLIVSSRAEREAEMPAWPEMVRMDLAPLLAAGTDALLQALLGPSTGLAPLKALLAARTDGNPLFLQESVRSLVETGVLAGERGAYRLEKPLGAIHIPDRIQALLAARIDRLDEQDKALLQAVAVIGKGATTTLIGRVSGAPTSDLPGVLAALDSAGFLCGGGLLPDLTYSFRHALTHDVVYASMLRNQRCGLHARALAALQAMYGERLDEHVERLAHQAIHAEAWTEALPYLRGAAEKAVARAANVEAVEWLGAALDALRHMPKSPASIPSGIDVRLDLVAPLLQLGRLDPVLTLAHEAERLAAEIDDCHRLGRAQACLVNYHYLRGEPAQALEHGERCLALLDWQREPRLAALAHRYMAHSHHAQGDYRRAASVLEEGLASLEQTAHGGDPAATTDKVASCAWLAFARAELGDFEAAQEWAAHARALAQTREHPYPSAIAWTMTGLVAMTRGEPANAIEAVTRALDLCRGARLTVWQPIASALLGQSLAMLGRVEDAQPLLQDSVRLSRELGVRAYLARWTTSLGEGYLAAGDLESAGHEAKLAVDLACEHGERGHEAYALSLLGAIASGQDGSAGLALQHYGRALALAEALGMRPLVARIRLGIGTAWRQAGQRAAAEEHLAHAIAMLGELSMPFWFERAARELNQLGRDVVISPSRAILRERLSQLAVDVPLRLMLDRRQNERRQRAAGAHAERRGEERRRCHVDRQMRAYGLAVVAPVTT